LKKIKSFLTKKSTKALSLAEVIMALGIISTVMVASISFMISSLIRVQVSELEDQANSLMIKALEVAKSPTRLNIDAAQISTIAPMYFSLNEFNQLISQSQEEIGTCNNINVYNSTTLLDETFRRFPVCLQVIFIPLQDAAARYEVRSKAIFINGEEVREVSLIGYRYDPL
jgi:hypothetical protein